MVVNFLRKGGGQVVPEYNRKVLCLQVVNFLRNQVVNLTGFSTCPRGDHSTCPIETLNL